MITAYTKEMTVDRKCKEVTLMKNKIVAYKKEWIRYGYFEFTGSEVIKPNQRIMVQKKVEFQNSKSQVYENIVLYTEW